MSYKAIPFELHSVTSIISNIKSSIDTSYESWLSHHEYSGELVLYHYTTLEGFKGIINNRSIRCSEIHTMNDPSELKYGKELFESCITDLIKENEKHYIIEILEQLKSYIEYLQLPHFRRHFIACFCKKDNLLSQWRGYALKGGGYNIGISFDSSTCICPEIDNIDDVKPLHLRKIIYNQEDQKKIIETYIRDLIKSIIIAVESDGFILDASINSKIALYASNLLFDMMLSMKNYAFHEEEEWRLIRLLRSDESHKLYKFNEINNELIPYLDTYIYKKNENELVFPLNSIRFGPTLDKIKTKIAIDLFYDKSKTLNHKINLKKEISSKDSGFILTK
ncbi:MAG: DUF2971 domain-containing protein [Ignavibacteriales bacterium]|nr:MAG: DUF2971 domain-containing protein [Ignavibacteriales bacterium]